MIDYSVINRSTVRTTFFILFVGGLYFLLSSLVTTFCNTILFGWIHIPCITTLEGAGVIGFLCVIYFGISFGLKHKNEKMFNNSQKTNHISNTTETKENYSNYSNINNKEHNFNETYGSIIDKKMDNTCCNEEHNIFEKLNEVEEFDDLIKYKNAIKRNKTMTKISDSKCLKNIEKMTNEQKLQLQLTLAKSCGIELESKIESKN